MRQAGMVRAGGRSGVEEWGRGQESRRWDSRWQGRTDGREAEGRKRDGGMGKWVRAGGQEKKLGGFVYYLLTSGVVIAAYLAVMGGMSQSGGAAEAVRVRCQGIASFADVVGGFDGVWVFWAGDYDCLCGAQGEFRSFGLKWEKLGVTVLLSALSLCAGFVSMLFRNEVHSYLPFQTVNFTKQVLEAGFPVSLAGMVIIAASWGFEGFSYVVIAERVNQLFPVRRVWHECRGGQPAG